MAEETQSEGKVIANLIMNDLKSLLKKNKLTIEQSPLAPEVIGFLGRSIASGALKKQKARDFLAKWFNENLEKRNEQTEGN